MPDSSLFMAVLLQQAFFSLYSAFACVQIVHILPVYKQAVVLRPKGSWVSRLS